MMIIHQVSIKAPHLPTYAGGAVVLDLEVT